ncbi:MAG: hypothetical protein JOZ41_03730 [Chloroflexi bacterium]|nr:hypothetical protein [Chloroflexota bacterium]
MDHSASGGGACPAAVQVCSAGEGSVPLPEIVRLLVVEGAIAALVSLVLSVFLSVLLQHMAGLADQSGGMLTEAFADLSFALTVPMHITLSANGGMTPTLIADAWIHWPIGLFTLVVLGACAMAGWRAARLTRVGAPAGFGVALTYATIVGIIVYVTGEYSQITSALSNSWQQAQPYSSSVTVDPGQTWEYAFAWALVPALLGAGAGRAALTWARSRWTAEMVERWRVALVGALWAVAASLILCGAATLLALPVWTPGSPTLSGNSSKIASGFLATAPVWCIHALALGAGASLRVSLNMGAMGSESIQALSLLGHWPLTNWGYVLPLVVVSGFLVGARKAHTLRPGRTTAFTLVLPFALLNTSLAWLGGMAAEVRLSQDYVDQLAQYLGPLGSNTQSQVMAALTGSGVTVGYGPDLLEVFLGSAVVGLVAATLVYFWLDPNSPAAQVPTPMPAGPGAAPTSEPSPSPEIDSQDRSLPDSGDGPMNTGPSTDDPE